MKRKKIPGGILNMLSQTMAETTNKDVEFDGSYWGDIAISFKNGDQLLLPVMHYQVDSILNQFKHPKPMKLITLISLDNRALVINRSQVSDIYVTHDACDQFGPEGDITADYIFPPMMTNYWENVDGFHASERNEDFDPERLTPNQKELWKTFKDSEDQDQLFKRATEVTWRLATGKTRSITAYDDELVYAQFINLLENSNDDDFAFQLDQHEEARQIIVMASAINYIWFPWHKVTNTIHSNIEAFEMLGEDE